MTCDWHGCKRPPTVGYLGWHLCDGHFARVMEEPTPQARQASAERGCDRERKARP